jgi:hypothetical protein
MLDQALNRTVKVRDRAGWRTEEIGLDSPQRHGE